MSTEIESLELKISSDSKTAVKGIDALTQSLTKLKSATKGGLGLSGVSKELEGLSSTSKKMKDVSKSTEGAKSSFTDFHFKIGMVTKAFKSAYSTISSLVKKSSDYYEVVNLFSVSMGEYAGAAYDYANKVSEVMGIDPAEWMKNQGVFMTLASGFGVAGDRAAKMSEQLTQLGYDISSFQNISVEDAMQKLQSGLAGELEPLRRIGYDLSQAKLEATALELGIDKSVSSMTQAEKAQLRYYAIMTQVTQQQGDMARTLEDPANQMRILRAQFEQAARAIGNIFLPAVQAILPYVTATAKLVRELADSIASLVGYEMPEIDITASDSISTAAENTSSSMEEATESAKKLKSHMLGIDELNVINPNTDSAAEDGTSLGFDFELPEYDFLGKATSDKVDGIVSKIKEMIKPLQDIIDITKEWIGGLDLESLSSEFGGLGKSMSSAFSLFGSVLSWVYEKQLLPVAEWAITVLLPAFMKLFNSTVAWASRLDLEPIKKALEGILTATEPIATKIVEVLGWVHSEVLLPIAEWAVENGIPVALDATTKALDAVYAAVSPVIDGLQALKPVLEPIVSWIGDVFNKVIEQLGEKFALVGAMFEDKGGTIKDTLASIGEIVSVLWTILEPILNVVVEFIQKFIDFSIDWIINDMITIIDTVAGVVEFVAGVFTGDWEKAWGGIEKIFGATWNYFKNIVKLTWRSIVDTITSAWDLVVAVFSSVGQWFYNILILPIFNFFVGLWEDIKGIWSVVATWFDENVIQPIINFFSPIVETISQFFRGCWLIIQAVWVVASTWFDETFIQPTVALFEGLWESVSGFFSSLWEDIKAVWNVVATWFDETVVQPIVGVFEPIKTKVSGIFSSLWEDIKGVWNKAATWFDDTIIKPVKTAFEKACNSISGFFSNLWLGIRRGVANAMNGVIGAIESAINWVIGGINNLVGGFDKLVQWAADVLGKDWGSITLLQQVKFSRVTVPTYAEGGFPEQGQMFIAREAGAEMVGNIGRRTAVANNEQIVAGIAGGVAEANEEQNALLREQNSLLRALLEKDSGVYLDGKNLTNSVEKYQRERGRVLIAGGVL